MLTSQSVQCLRQNRQYYIKTILRSVLPISFQWLFWGIQVFKNKQTKKPVHVFLFSVYLLQLLFFVFITRLVFLFLFLLFSHGRRNWRPLCRDPRLSKIQFLKHVYLVILFDISYVFRLQVDANGGIILLGKKGRGKEWGTQWHNHPLAHVCCAQQLQRQSGQLSNRRERQYRQKMMYGSYYTHIIAAPRSKKARPSLTERQDCTAIQGRLQPNTAIDTTGSACMAVTTCITTVIPASVTITACYTLSQQSFRSVWPSQYAEHSVSSYIIPAYEAITTCWTLCQQLHYSGLCGHHNMLNTLSAVTLFSPMWPSQRAEHSVSRHLHSGL